MAKFQVLLSRVRTVKESTLVTVNSSSVTYAASDAVRAVRDHDWCVDDEITSEVNVEIAREI